MEIEKLTKELLVFSRDMYYPVCFAAYKTSEDEGVTIFQSKTHRHLFNVSKNSKSSIADIFDVLMDCKRNQDELKDLANQKNKISRKISSLKKASTPNQ